MADETAAALAAAFDPSFLARSKGWTHGFSELVGIYDCSEMRIFPL
jgi:hypothetical protein